MAAELKSWKTCVIAVDGWKDDEGQETLGATALSCSHKHKPLVLLVEQQHCRQVLDTLHHPFLSHLFPQFALDISAFLKKAADLVAAASCCPIGFITDNAGHICNAVEMQPDTMQLNCLEHSAELLVKDINSLWPGLDRKCTQPMPFTSLCLQAYLQY